MQLKVDELVEVLENDLEVGNPPVLFLPEHFDVGLDEPGRVLVDGALLNGPEDGLGVLAQVDLEHAPQHGAGVDHALVLLPGSTVDVDEDDPVDELLHLRVLFGEGHQGHGAHRVSHQSQLLVCVQLVVENELVQIVGQVGYLVTGCVWRLAMVAAVDQIAIYIIRNLTIFSNVFEILKTSIKSVMNYHVSNSPRVIQGIVESY